MNIPQTPPEQKREPDEVVEFLRRRIAPVLSTHLGGVRLDRAEGSRMHVRLTHKCASCYFRPACIDGVLRPELEQAFGERYEFSIR